MSNAIDNEPNAPSDMIHCLQLAIKAFRGVSNGSSSSKELFEVGDIVVTNQLK